MEELEQKEPTLDDMLIAEMDRLYRYAFNQTRDPYLSEDIVQDVVVQCYRSYPRLRDKSRTQAWIWGIARNLVMRSFKGKKELPADEITIISLAGVSYETPETELVHREEIAKLRRALSYLAKNYREVCILHYLDGLDYNTIAERLNIPLSSVKWRLSQSKEQIRKEFTKMEMEYMNKGYRRAIPLKLDMGGVATNANPEDGRFENAAVLDNLLAQNVCIVARDQAESVTEIASELGVSADFIEDTLDRLVKVQAIRPVSDKYRTAFPILSGKALEEIMGGNRELARAKARKILDAIAERADDIAKVGFIGADWGIERLIPCLLMSVTMQIDGNSFDEEKLPFRGTGESAWYILGTTGENQVRDFVSTGLDSMWDAGVGTFEQYFRHPAITHGQMCGDAERKAFVEVYQSGTSVDRAALSRLVETGKIEKEGDHYRIVIPTLSEEQEEVIQQILAPVVEMANSLQAQILERSERLIRKALPAHLKEQAEFFRGYFGEGVIESACMDEYLRRGLPLEIATVGRMIVKKPVINVIEKIIEVSTTEEEQDNGDETSVSIDVKMTAKAEI